MSTAAALLAPSRASAQISYTIQEFGGRDAPVLLYGTNGRPLSGEECDSNVSIPIEIVNAPFQAGSTQIISIWRGAPTSAACQTATNRRSTAGGDPPCTFVTSTMLTASMQDVSLPVRTAFGSCDTATEQEFWFLIVNSAMDTSTDVATSSFFTVRAALDPTAPGAPTELEGTPGDREISLEWTNPDAVESLQGARVYFDPAGCDASGNVGTTELMGGSAPPSGARSIEVDGLAVRTATVSGEDLGLEYNDYAAVAVTIVDRAGNESVLSNVTCVQRVQVRGFWDAYCTERGMDAETCTENYGCGIAQPGARGSAMVFGLAMLAMIGLVARRTRRVR